MNRDQIIARLGEIGDELEKLDVDSLDEQSATRFDELTAEADELRAQQVKIEARDAKRAEVRNAIDAGRVAFEHGDDRGVPSVHVRKDPTDVLSRQGVSDQEMRDAAMQVIERQVSRPEWQEQAEKHANRGRSFADHIVRHSGDKYAAAWSKMVTGRAHLMDVDEQRALAVSTNTQGGFMVPTHLDPTILLSNAGTINPFRQISRVVTLSQADGNTWNGVTSAGSTASWDAEEAEVSDDSPELVQPSVPVYKGAAFVAASVEAFGDIGGLAGDVVAILQDAKDRLEAAAFTTGSGSAQPTGIFTALDANTNVELEVTTQGSIGAVDIYAAYEKVPARFRMNSTWVSNLKYINAIRQLGASDPNFTVDFTAAGIPQLLGKRILEASDGPSAITTTGVENLLVVGDFSNFVIVDKIGMSVEFVPTLFGANNRPTGQRGWYAYWRTGSDSVLDAAFTLLQDGTSA